jgi:predicted RNA-binding protein YlxR (DUF448 family)
VVSHRHARKVDADEGPDTGPGRTCVVTRNVRDPDDLVRFVLAPDSTVVPDFDRKLPGRGVWVTLSREVIEKAIKNGAFSRGLKASAKADAELPARMGEMLERRLANTLALANKAGLVSAGFQQVESALEKATVAVLVHGSDAAADGCHKLDRKFRAIQNALERQAPIVTALTVEQISLAMGRPSVVHAALISGGLTERFLREAERLVRYRGSPAVSEFAVSAPELEPKAETDKA